MKIKIAILTAAVAAIGFSAFGQGYVTFSASSSRLWDEFTTPGSGVRGSGNINLTFLWAATGATDYMPSLGTQFSTSAGSAVNQVATNGVTSSAVGISGIQNMLANGWQFASNGTALASVTISASGGFNYGQFQLNGTSASTAYQFVVIGWDSASGLTAILNGNVAALGWSNPFNYTTGASASDPVGTSLFSQTGMNQFGVAAVPEPTALALAGLGAASLLIFRRRK